MSNYRGNYRSRKRYRDDDEHSYRPSRNGPGQGMIARIKKDITYLVDPRSSSSPSEDMNYVATEVARESQDEIHLPQVIDSLFACALQLPVKIPFLATMLMLASTKNHNLLKVAVETCSTRLQESLLAFKFYEAKIYLRLLTCLTRVLTEEKIGELLGKIVEAFETQSCSVYADELAYLVLLTLPYFIVASFSPKVKETCSSIIDRCSTYLNSRSVDVNDMNPFLNSTYNIQDKLSLLYSQITKLKENDFTVSILPTPWDSFESELSSIESVSFELPTLPEEIPDDKKAAPKGKPFIELLFSQPVRTTPELSNIASTILRDNASDVLNQLEFNRTEAARVLTDFDVYFAYKSFALRGTPIAELEKASPSEPTWKAEDVIAESVFAELFSLASPRYKPVYYHSVLTECCRTAPRIMAPTFGRIIRFMYSMSENLDLEPQYRFIDWVSHHLSNFGFQWKWQEWVEDVDLEELHPKKVVMREMIRREVDLSYWGRIRDSVAEPMYGFLTEKAPEPYFPYGAEDHPMNVTSHKITNQLTMREPIASIEAELSSFSQEEALRLFFSCVFHMGSKSFSHMLNVFEKHIDVIKHFSRASSDSEYIVVSSLFEYWKFQPTIAVTWADKLLNYSIVGATAIIQWLTKQDDIRLWSRIYVWDLLTTTLNKLDARVKQFDNSEATEGTEENVLKEESTTERRAVYELLRTRLPELAQSASLPWSAHYVQLVQAYLERHYPLMVQMDDD